NHDVTQKVMSSKSHRTLGFLWLSPLSLLLSKASEMEAKISQTIKAKTLLISKLVTQVPKSSRPKVVIHSRHACIPVTSRSAIGTPDAFSKLNISALSSLVVGVCMHAIYHKITILHTILTAKAKMAYHDRS